MGQITTQGNSVTGTGANLVTDTGATLTSPTINNPTISGATITGTVPNVATLTTSGAVTISSGTKKITASSAATLTIAAPSSQDGIEMTFVTTTAVAQVLTFTGGTLNSGATGAFTTVTFTAKIGANIRVMALGAIWIVLSSQNVSLS